MSMLMPYKMNEYAKVSPPMRATACSAAWDLHADTRQLTGEDYYRLEYGEIDDIPLGVQFELLPDYAGFLLLRSKWRRQLNLANGVGLIDEDYRGQLYAPIECKSPQGFCISHNMRIAQFVVMYAPTASIELVRKEVLNDTERGHGGFGHTGV